MTSEELKALRGQRIYVDIDGMPSCWATVGERADTVASTPTGKPERGWWLDLEPGGLTSIPPSMVTRVK